jgi:uncharacterized protein YecT (DUF1311 family)
MRYVLMIAAMLVAIGFGGVAGAQDLRYSDDATVECVNRAGSLLEQRACVGASANVCINATPDGQTTYGMGGCLDQELSFWDGILNINYQNARKRAKEVDREMKALGTNQPSLDQTLRDMQRAWIPYRDATCDFERGLWGGGTGGGPATLSCLLRLTGEQALYLNEAWIGD